MMQKVRIMFVCLGNICRSPMAEAIMQNKVKTLNLEELFDIESCGTAGYHIGENADPRTLNVLAANGISFKHSAQQLNNEISENFDYLIAMDADNKRNIQLSTGRLNKVMLMKDFGEKHNNMEISDPYYGSASGFETCFSELDYCIDAFLDYLKIEHGMD